MLVVEDHESCRDEVCETLRSAGYAAFEASSGAEALEMLVSDRMPEPGLILLDLGLPVMTGEELMELLRGYHRLAQIPVVIMSANMSRPENSSGAGWLPKPFTAELLIEQVAKRYRDLEPRAPTEMTG